MDLGAIVLLTAPTYVLAPEQIGTATGWSEVAAAWHHVLARRGGELYTWGDNSHGQLGDGTLVSRTSPAVVGAGTTWTRVAAGAYSSQAVASGSEHRVWGSNQLGELGIGTCGRVHDRWSPARVP